MQTEAELNAEADFIRRTLDHIARNKTGIMTNEIEDSGPESNEENEAGKSNDAYDAYSYDEDGSNTYEDMNKEKNAAYDYDEYNGNSASKAEKPQTAEYDDYGNNYGEFF